MGWPLYSTADLEAFAAVEELRQLIAEREAWLAISLSRAEAAALLGWKLTEFDRLAEHGLQPRVLPADGRGGGRRRSSRRPGPLQAHPGHPGAGAGPDHPDTIDSRRNLELVAAAARLGPLFPPVRRLVGEIRAWRARRRSRL